MWSTEIYRFFYGEDIACFFFFLGGGGGVGDSLQSATFHFSAFSVSLNVLRLSTNPNKISDTRSSKTLLQTQIKVFINIPMTTV
jgi:hypothetical protein